MVCLVLVALGAVEPLSTWGVAQQLVSRKARTGLSTEVDGQHGDRIETWAFSTCLLLPLVKTVPKPERGRAGRRAHTTCWLLVVGRRAW